MPDTVIEFIHTQLVRRAIRANWQNYHYCLGRSPSVELSIGRYLTWFITTMPDHFMNLVVCTQLPAEGIDELIEGALTYFQSKHITRLSWLVQEGVPADELKKHLLARGLTFRESFAAEMAVDLQSVKENRSIPGGLTIIPVEDRATLKKWIQVASIGFGVPADVEDIWHEFFVEAVCEHPFKTYLALLDGKPVATSQLFTSAGVAGIYNITPNVQLLRR
jgi:hypothetical protein